MHFDVRRALVANWPMKLTSLAVAAVLWAVIAAQEPRSQFVPVRLLLELPTGRSLATPPPNVEALFTGPGRELFKLYSSPPFIELAVPDDPAPTHRLDLSLQNLRYGTDAAVSVQDLRPRQITIRLDSVTTKSVPVFSNATVVPDTGYQLVGDIEYSPSTIVITGSEAELSSITGVPTLPFSRENVRSTVRATVDLDTTGLSAVRLSAYRVTVAAVVVEITTRVLDNVRVQIVADGSDSMVADPATVLVTIRGPANRVERMTPDSVTVTVRPPEGAGAEANLVVRAPVGIAATATPDVVQVRRIR